MSAAKARSAPAPRRLRRSYSQLTWNSGQADREELARLNRPGPVDPSRPASGKFDPSAPKGMGYEVLSYMISGPLAYGGLGWLIGHFTNLSVLFPIGMLVGLAISTGWVIYRYGVKGESYGAKDGQKDQPTGHGQEQRREETCR